MKAESTLRRELAALNRAKDRMDSTYVKCDDLARRQLQRPLDQTYGAIEALRRVLDQDAPRPRGLGNP